MDRLTEGAYAEFYERWYRSLVSVRVDRRPEIGHLKRDQVVYARHIGDALEGYLDLPNGFRLLDIGGSTGTVASEFERRFHCRGTVVDPSPREIEEARRAGLDGRVGSIEEWEDEEPFDLVLLCRTIDHLHDLRGSLARIRTLVKPGGFFYCDVLDLMDSCRKNGPPQTVFKVDHCYYFLFEAMEGLWRRIGFEVVGVHHHLIRHHVGFLLRPTEPREPDPLPPSTVHATLRRFGEIHAEWQAQARLPRTFGNSLRLRLYQLKTAMLSGGRRLGRALGR